MSVMIDELVECLRRSKVCVEAIPRAEKYRLWECWLDAFKAMFEEHVSKKEGAKARHAYRMENAREWLILSIDDSTYISFAHTSGPSFGLRCAGPLVPLDTFCGIEFVVAPDDLAWTMVHTHEDDGYGGPWYTRADWQ